MIDEALDPESGYCNICLSHNTIISNKNVGKKFCFCFNCGVYEILSNNNLLQYFIDLNLIISFISANFDSSLQVSNTSEGRLVYFGLKERINYYFLYKVNSFNFSSALKRIRDTHNCYIFCLDKSYYNPHNLKIPKKIKLYSLLECLIFSKAGLQFLLPKLPSRTMVARMGGLTCSEKKFGKVRRFVQALFKQKKTLRPGLKKKEICLEILNELIERPDLISNLSEDNLFDWITKQTRHLK